MTKFNFTDRNIAALKPKSERYEVQDTGVPSLICRVSPKGKKFLMLHTRFPGHTNPTRRAIGQHGRVVVEEARRIARHWFDLIHQGIDPQVEQERLLREQERARADRFGEAMELYIVARSDLRRATRSAREIRRNLRPWADRPIRSITPRDVIERIEGVIKGSGVYEARSAWSHANALFKWAVHRGLIEANPCASVSKKELFGDRIVPRERVLSDEELRALWRATLRLPYPYGPFYRLLVLAPVRLNELARARWSEFHPELRRLLYAARGDRIDWRGVPGEVKLWTIPADRFKTGTAHLVALSDAALAELEVLPHHSDLLLFTYGRVPIRAVETAKRQLDKRMLRTLKALARTRGEDPNKVTLPRWVNHDLRRVVRSHLAALQVPDHIAEKCLGHSRRGIQRVYDRYQYIDEQRTAMNAWANRLRGIVAPPPPPRPRRKVVPLRRKRA